MPRLKPELEFEAIGTRWYIELTHTPSAELVAMIRARIEDFDRAYSRFRNDSLVTRLATDGGSITFPDDFGRMHATYEHLYNLTDAHMTPLIGRALSDAGYDAQYSLTSRPLNAVPRWEHALEINGNTVTVPEPTLLDFGAVGKGYLVDLVCELLEASGEAEYLVNAGGDMRYRGPEPIELALEDPAIPGALIGTIDLAPRMALCGSAMNRRAWGDYHHVIDPLSLASPREIMAIWVIAADARTADGLTTALLFASPETLLVEFTFEFAIIWADGRVRRSDAFVSAFSS